MKAATWWWPASWACRHPPRHDPLPWCLRQHETTAPDGRPGVHPGDRRSGPGVDRRGPVLRRLPEHARLEHRSAVAGAGLLWIPDQPLQPDPADPARRRPRDVVALQMVQRRRPADRGWAAAFRDAVRDHREPRPLPGPDLRRLCHLAAVSVDDAEPGVLRGRCPDQGRRWIALPRVALRPGAGHAPDLGNPEIE